MGFPWQQIKAQARVWKMLMNQEMNIFLRETWELWYWGMFYPSRLRQWLDEGHQFITNSGF
jgi:hypothetical protein